MSEEWMMELWRGPFEDAPPLLFDLDDGDDEPPAPQEGASVRPEGTMDS